MDDKETRLEYMAHSHALMIEHAGTEGWVARCMAYAFVAAKITAREDIDAVQDRTLAILEERGIVFDGPVAKVEA